MTQILANIILNIDKFPYLHCFWNNLILGRVAFLMGQVAKDINVALQKDFC